MNNSLCLKLGCPSNEVERLKKENKELRDLNLFPQQNPQCGISWNGFCLQGDKKSIDEVHRLMNLEYRLKYLQTLIDEKKLVYAKES